MELTRVRPVFEHEGPFVTVHAQVGRATEDARQQLEARWTSVRQELERTDLAADVVEEIGTRLKENTHRPGEVRRTIVASADGIVFDEVQSGHSARPETVDVGPLPDVSGWLAVAECEMPFVLVVVDREGADIDLYSALSQGRSSHESVEGETYYITKVAEGDWAQKQFQQTAENRWHHNAQLVADRVRSIQHGHAVRAVLVAGEVRMRADVCELLEDLDADVLPIEAGGRAAGASETALWDEVRTALAHLEALDDDDVAERLAEGRGRGRGAAHGLDDVLDALVTTRVERLVLDLDRTSEKTVRPGQHPGLMLPPGAGECDELPADRTLLAAAALSGAEVSLLPSELSHGGGVAALLRWDE
jgi:hypothetical protein